MKTDAEYAAGSIWNCPVCDSRAVEACNPTDDNVPADFLCNDCNSTWHCEWSHVGFELGESDE